MIRTLSRLVLLLLAVLLCSSAWGTALLKSSGGAMTDLREKSLSTDVKITGQFAETTQTIVFQNECQERIEADFIYTLPSGATATYFAYWAGDEKVVARIVDKERAAEIYRAITTRQRDPALIELIGRNTFRARIFPVMPNADLKVGIRFVQAIPSDAQGATYALPLYEGKDGPTLDSFKVNVGFGTDESRTAIETNFGIPVTQTKKVGSVSFTGESYRPSKDLRIGIRRSPAPLQTSLFSAPSGGSDGFFALALTPNHSLSKAKVKIAGVCTYDVTPVPSSVKANQAIMIYGRYKGSGAAVVTLDGVSPDGAFHCSHTVCFGSKPDPDNMATKLWAAARIEQLGSNKRAVLDLSKRFTLPSKFTSWLAVPKAEMEMYRREKAEREVCATADRIAYLISVGKGSTSQAKQLRALLDEQCRLAGKYFTPHLMLSDALDGIEWRSGEELARLIASGKDQTPRGKYLRGVFTRLNRGRRTGKDGGLRTYLTNELDSAVWSLVGEKNARRPNAAKIADYRRRVTRLEHASGASAKKYLDEAEHYYLPDKIDSARSDLLKEMVKASPDAARLNALDKKFIDLGTRYHNRQYALDRLARVKLKSDIDLLDAQIMAARRTGDAPKETKLAEQQTKLVNKETELRVRMGDPLIAVDAPVDARQVIALMPNGEVKRLRYVPQFHRWEARFDVPGYATEGDYVIKIIVTLKDGSRKNLKMTYTVDLTPPQGKVRASLVQGLGRKLRLEADCDPDTARVVALTPWGDRIAMSPSSVPHRFFALAAAPIGDWGSASVTFILTDKAHNRTDLDCKRGGWAMKYRLLLPAILLLVLSNAAIGDPISPGKDTLYTSTRDVRAMVAAPDGSLWAATTGGVLRRAPDGKWTKFTQMDGLPSCEALDIRLDGDRIAVVLPTADAIWSKGKWTTKPAHNESYNRPRAFTAVFKGKTYRSNPSIDESLEVRDSGAWSEISVLSFNAFDVTGLLQFGDELLIFTRDDGTSSSTDGSSWKHKEFGLPDESGEINAVTVMGGKLWLGTSAQGIWEYDGKTATQHLQPDEPCGLDCRAMRVFKGRLCVSTTDGIAVRTGSGWASDHEVGLSDRVPHDMVEFKDNLYALVENGRVDRYDGTKWTSQVFDVTRGQIGAIAADATRIYAGQWGGWSEWDGKTWSDRLRNPRMQGCQVACLLPDGNTLWVGVQGLGLAEVNETTGTIKWHDERNGLLDDWVTCLRKVGGRLYAGTFYGGLEYYEGGKWTVSPKLRKERINDIVPDGRGGVLVATVSGVWRFADGKTTRLFSKPNSPDSEANCLCVVDDGLWIGTRTGIFFAAGRP